MISHTSSISSSIGNHKSIFKEKDFDLINYFDESDNEIDLEKNKNKNIVKKTSLFKDNDNDVFSVDNYSSSEELKEDEYFNIDDDSIFDYNEKVVEVSPDGNFGKVNKILYNLN